MVKRKEKQNYVEKNCYEKKMNKMFKWNLYVELKYEKKCVILAKTNSVAWALWPTKNWKLQNQRKKTVYIEMWEDKKWRYYFSFIQE